MKLLPTKLKNQSYTKKLQPGVALEQNDVSQRSSKLKFDTTSTHV